MKILYFMPKGLKDYFKLMINRKKFKNAYIGTPYISKNVEIGYSCSINSEVVINNNCRVDNYSYVNSGTKLGYVSIGKFCSIGSDCEIGMQNHPIGFISTSPRTYGPKSIFNNSAHYNEFESLVIIGNDVWVGSKVIIMQGVIVGDGAIIGAGAIVTKNIEPYSIVAGAPAKEIRKRFSKKEIEFLQNLKWWDKSISDLESIEDLFLQGCDWIDYV